MKTNYEKKRHVFFSCLQLGLHLDVAAGQFRILFSSSF